MGGRWTAAFHAKQWRLVAPAFTRQEAQEGTVSRGPRSSLLGREAR